MIDRQPCSYVDPGSSILGLGYQTQNKGVASAPMPHFEFGKSDK